MNGRNYNIENYTDILTIAITSSPDYQAKKHFKLQFCLKCITNHKPELLTPISNLRYEQISTRIYFKLLFPGKTHFLKPKSEVLKPLMYVTTAGVGSERQIL